MHCIVHVGGDKTGSTALQHCLASNREALIARGVCYPWTGSYFGNEFSFKHEGQRHIGLMYAMKGAPVLGADSRLAKMMGIVDQSSLEAYRRSFLQSFDDEIELAGRVNTVIISDEGLFRNSNPDMLQGLHDFLSNRFSSVEIVLYIRPLFSYLNSAYGQHVKMGGRLCFDEFCSAVMVRPISQRVMNWVAVFGVDSVCLRAYVQCSRDIVRDFSTAYSLNLECSASTLKNTALSPVGVKFLLRLNTLFRGRKPSAVVRKLFESLFSGEGGDYASELDQAFIERLLGEQEKLDGLLKAFSCGSVSKRIA